MAILNRKTLFSLAIGGLVSTTTAWSQDADVPQAPAASEAPAAADAVIEPVPDRPGVVQVSDCPPAEFSENCNDGDGGSFCRQHVPPHSGWNQPGRRPMHRSWVPYHKFFPGSWTGHGTPEPQHRAPLVYMPTDTTQLGYYYQHAPTWHAYPGMIPPVPRPSDWHYPYHEQSANCPPGAYGQVTYPGQTMNFGTPTIVPQAPEPSLPAETDPVVPSDASLDRSASIPELTPIPR